MAARSGRIVETDDTLVSVEEYIARFVDGGEKPTCEYVDGELIPKSMATRKHSQTQQNVQFQIRQKYGEVFNPLPELTTRLSKEKFYVPDVAVEERAHATHDRHPGPDNPVFLCIEILSPPDRIGRAFGKCEDYHSWGVPHCWVIDPERKIAWEYTPEDPEPRRVGEALSASPITIALADVFEGV